ncbi:MAG: hypothetical protein JW953_07970 [Anaerolineae bacterium]|nr:hypothetical protein [Anaerolineae bacterium]
MAKRSRRTRLQQAEKRKQVVPPAVEPAPGQAITDATTPGMGVGQSTQRKIVDFVQEYAYVYKEMRNIVLIALLMFVVLIGLSFVI